MNRMKRNFLSLVLLGYVLGSYKGYVAMWKEGNPDPQQIFPYKVEALPPADQAALEEGIHVPGEKELEQLLEDYLS